MTLYKLKFISWEKKKHQWCRDWDTSVLLLSVTGFYASLSYLLHMSLLMFFWMFSCDAYRDSDVKTDPSLFLTDGTPMQEIDQFAVFLWSTTILLGHWYLRFWNSLPSGCHHVIVFLKDGLKTMRETMFWQSMLTNQFNPLTEAQRVTHFSVWINLLKRMDSFVKQFYTLSFLNLNVAGLFNGCKLCTRGITGNICNRSSSSQKDYRKKKQLGLFNLFGSRPPAQLVTSVTYH